MAVYVDDPKIKWQGDLWCHLVADNLQELHDFALKLKVKRYWFHDNASYPHYDINYSTRVHALKLGAKEADRFILISRAKNLKEELKEHNKKRNKQLFLF